MLGGLGSFEMIFMLLLWAIPVVVLFWFVNTLSSMARSLGQIADRMKKLEAAVREVAAAPPYQR